MQAKQMKPYKKYFAHIKMDEANYPVAIFYNYDWIWTH